MSISENSDKRIYVKILGLSEDGEGLNARTSDMDNDSFFRIDPSEMTAYQKKIHNRLVKELNGSDDVEDSEDTIELVGEITKVTVD